MSEKRHATLDAKSTDTYQRNKKIRDERQRQKQQEDIQAEQMARERNMQGKTFKMKLIRHYRHYLIFVRIHNENELKEHTIVMSYIMQLNIKQTCHLTSSLKN